MTSTGLGLSEQQLLPGLDTGISFTQTLALVTQAVNKEPPSDHRYAINKYRNSFCNVLAGQEDLRQALSRFLLQVLRKMWQR